VLEERGHDVVTMRYDVVVAGLGAMGSATAYQLARSGASVLGVDRYRPPHALGSTHGDTRITRVAIGEGLAYVPLVRRSHELWQEIERETGLTVLTRCGGLVMAPPQATFAMHGSESFLEHTVAAAEAYGVEHERLGTADLAARFPQFSLAGDEQGCYEPGAGFVRPELAVEAQLGLARQLGATLVLDERVLGYDDHGAHVTVRTTHQTVEASTLVITAGPWVPELVPDLASTLRIHRQVLFWFDLRDPAAYPGLRDSPVYIWWPGGDRGEMIYGFPMVDGPSGGAKVAREQYAVETTPDEVDRSVAPEEIEQMYEESVRHRLPALSGRCVRTAVCLYTVSPDSRFVIDRVPSMPNVIVASPCSGHGFKHSAAIGEALAQLATRGQTTLDLSPFALDAD
jgi:sarcosine oxidase